MSKTNCVNCGHGKDPDAIKCPFCGTTYLDMTGIDLTVGEPVVLMLKDPCFGNNILHMLARPTMFDVHIACDEPIVCDIGFTGSRPRVFINREPDIDVNIQFVGQ